jgi:ribose 1,5-bisphosphokinase PhnN
MANCSDYINCVVQRLQDDSALNALVDGQVIGGFRRALADDYLAGSHHVCIGVRSLSKNSIGLGGCAWHGGANHDQLIEIRVITLLSATRQDDSYAYAIGDEIERILRAGFEQVMNGTTYYISSIPYINFTALDDDQLTDRIEIQATARLKYIAR